MIIDLLTYDIDLIQYLIGLEFKEIHYIASKNLSQYEDIAVLLFEITNGMLARVMVHWLPETFEHAIIELIDNLDKAEEMDQKLIEWIMKHNSYNILAR